MLKLSRKSEYALMALQLLGTLPEGERLAVPVLAERRDIPRDLLAKIMQDLKRAGLVRSVQGVGGGYELARPLREIGFMAAIAPFEEVTGLVKCVESRENACSREDCCALYDPMRALNRWLMGQLQTLSLEEVLSARLPARLGAPGRLGSGAAAALR
jgi:Rrf2 family protein